MHNVALNVGLCRVHPGRLIFVEELMQSRGRNEILECLCLEKRWTSSQISTVLICSYIPSANNEVCTLRVGDEGEVDKGSVGTGSGLDGVLNHTR